MTSAAPVARPPERTLVISLHDVSPFTRDVFAAMLAELAALGVSHCSLLVIPDHHGRGRMLSDAGFCRWLESLAKQGHELVIHGYFHQRTAKPAENLRDRWMTSIYTKGEGEFYDLPKDEASALLARARADFAQLDAPQPTGFIAPAWLLGAGAAEAVREAGFHYTTYLTGVEECPTGGFIKSRSLVYSCRNAWRRVCSLGWNAALARRLDSNPLLRIGLHPPDYRHAAVWRQVRRIVSGLLEGRSVSTYHSFMLGRPR